MSSGTSSSAFGSPRRSAVMSPIARRASGGGGPSPASGKRRSSRARVAGALPSGSCTPTIARGPARSEERLRHLRRGGDEGPVGRLELRHHIGRLHARLAVHEARVPCVEVIVGARRVARLALPDAPEGRDHLVVPARDVDQDLAHTPAPEPDATHLVVAQPLDRSPQLGECLIGVVQPRALLAHGSLPDWWVSLYV